MKPYILALSFFCIIIAAGCDCPKCPDSNETVTAGDSTFSAVDDNTVDLLQDVVGYFSPSANVVYVKPDEKEMVKEVLGATDARGQWQLDVTTLAGKAVRRIVEVVESPFPVLQVGEEPEPDPDVVPAVVYKNHECREWLNAAQGTCSTKPDKDGFYTITKMLSAGTCRKGKGYCVELKGMKAVVVEYYQDSDCTVLQNVAAHGRDDLCKVN